MVEHALAATGEDRDDHADGGLIVEHFRVDPSRRLVRALALGSVVMVAGSLVVAVALLWSRAGAQRPLNSRAMRIGASDPLSAGGAVLVGGAVTSDGRPIETGSLALELALGLSGLACIVLGGGVAIVGLNRVLREEAFLALRTDGAFFRNGAERSLLRWEDCEEVRWDAGRAAVCFVRHDGRAWERAERYAGVEGAELARRAGEIRRKALFGLIR